MNPPKQEILSEKLQEGLAKQSVDERRRALMETIIGNASDEETEPHRRSRVERAKLAAQVMQNPDVSEVGVQVVSSAISKVEERYSAERRKLNATLLKKEREEVGRNMQKLQAELREYREAKLAMLQSVQAADKRPSMIGRIGETMKGGLSKAGDVLEGVTDKVLFKNWTARMTRGQKIGTALFGGVLAGYVLYKGTKMLMSGLGWLFGKAKNTVKSGLGFVGKLLLAAGVVTGGYYALRKLNIIPNLIGSLEEKGKKAVDDIKNAGKNMMSKIQKELGLDDDAKPRTEEEKKSGAKAEEETRKPSAKQEVKEVAENTGWKIVGRGMLFLHGDIAAELGIDQEYEKHAVISALMTMDPNLTLSDFLSVNSLADAQSRFGVGPNSAQAYLFLCKVMQKHAPRIRMMWEKEGKVWDASKVTLGDAMARVSEAPRVISSIVDSMNGKRWEDLDFKEIFSNAFGDGKNEGAQGLQGVVHPSNMERIYEMVPELKGKDEKEQRKIIAEFLLFTSKVRPLTLENFEMKYKDSEDPRAKAVLHIIREVKTEKMRKYFALYTHGRNEFAEVLEKQLDVMLVGDALQLFSYANMAHGKLPENIEPSMMKSGDGYAALLMQLKVLQLVGNHDHATGVRFRAALTVNADPDSINLPPEATETLAKIGSFAKEQAQKAATSAWERIWLEISAYTGELARKYPKVFTGLGIGGATVGTGIAGRILYKARKWYITPRATKIENWLNDLSRRSSTVDVKLLSPKSWAKWLFHTDFKADLPKIAGELKSTAIKTRMIVSKLGKTAAAKEVQKAYEALHRSGYSAKNFENLRGAIARLEKASPGSVGDCNRILANIDDMENYARQMQYARFGPARRFWHYVTGRGASKGVTTPKPATTKAPAAPKPKPATTKAPAAPGTVDDGGPVKKPAPSKQPSAKAPTDGPQFRIVRENGDVVDPKTGKVVEEATEGKNVVKIAEVLTEEKWAAALKELKGGKLTMDNVDEFLAWARKTKTLDDDVIGLITKSKSAKSLLVGAAESGELLEMNRVLTPLKAMKAGKFMKTLGVVGFAGDALGVYLAYMDYQANKGRIDMAKKTNNKALLDLYNNANIVYAAEGGGSAIGFTVGSVAFVKAVVAGKSVTTALAAAGGTIMLPMALATLAGRHVYNKAEGVTETWSRTSKDWVRVLEPGQLLEKLKELGPGKSSYWQGWGKGTVTEQAFRKAFTSRESFRKWEEDGQQSIEGANTSARYELTKAYVLVSTLLAPETGESTKDFERRVDLYIMDQMRYIGHITQGSFSYLMGSGYERARTYAKLMAKSRALKKKGASEEFSWKDDQGKTHVVDLAKFEDMPMQKDRSLDDRETVLGHYIYHEYVSTTVQLNLLEQAPVQMKSAEKDHAIKTKLILACQDGLFRLDGRIANADFAGWGSEEGLGEGYARYTAYRMVSDEITRQTAKIRQKAAGTQGLSVKDYQDAVAKILSILDETDPLKFQKIAKERGYYRSGYVLNPGSVRNLLSVSSFLKKANDAVKWEKVKKEIQKEVKVMTPQERSKYRHGAGYDFLIRKGMTGKGTKIFDMVSKPKYYQIQYGNVFNKYLYVRYVNGKWMVNFGGGGDGPWHDPSSFRATSSTFGFSQSVANKYNNIINGLSGINNQF